MKLTDLVKPEGERVERILGVDASTNSLGFCLFTKDGPEKWGEITFKGASVWERLSMGQKAVGLVADKLNPDLIVFESAVFVQNKKTVVLLAYAFGAIVSVLMRSGTRVEELPPITWQNAIGNKALTKTEKAKIQKQFPDKSSSWYSNKYREFRKERTRLWVKDNFDIDVKSDNVSDAIAIASVGHSKFASPTI